MYIYIYISLYASIYLYISLSLYIYIYIYIMTPPVPLADAAYQHAYQAANFIGTHPPTRLLAHSFSLSLSLTHTHAYHTPQNLASRLLLLVQHRHMSSFRSLAKRSKNRSYPPCCTHTKCPAEHAQNGVPKPR